MGLSFKVTRDDISPALGRLGATARNPRKVFLAMGNTFKSINASGAVSRLKPKVRPANRNPRHDFSQPRDTAANPRRRFVPRSAPIPPRVGGKRRRFRFKPFRGFV